MAHVTIDSGPVDADDALREVPQSKWFELMQVRRDFLGVHLPLDCRRLLEFVEDAEQMYGPLGFAGINDFIKRGLELDPQQVEWAIAGLQRMRPKEPIPYTKAIALGQQAGAPTGNKNAAKNKGSNTTIVLRKPIGRGAVYILARLKRDGHTELAAKVRTGEMSANAAAIATGIRKPPKLVCPKCGHEFTRQKRKLT